ncbi:MAG: hypothetical protein R3C10_04040 [Pirellulales bacterium]
MATYGRLYGATGVVAKWGVGVSFVDVVVSVNLKRRHLTTEQRAIVAVKRKQYHAELAKERMKSGKKADPPDSGPEGKGDARDHAG